MDGVTPAIAGRLERARDGDESRRLHVADLRPGQYGVLEVDIRHVHPAHTFQRRGGGDGTLRRVTVGDATGEIDVVLWGDEGRFAIDGPLVPGAHVRLLGPEVRDGYRGATELHLGGCRIEAMQTPEAAHELTGRLHEISDTRTVGEPPSLRFQADLALETAAGPVHVLLWDDAIKRVRTVLPGARMRVTGCRPHPQLDGWYIADGARIDVL